MSILQPTFNETVQLLDDSYTLRMTALKYGIRPRRTAEVFSHYVNVWIEHGVD